MTQGPSLDQLPVLLKDLQSRVQHGNRLHHKFLYQSSRPQNALERRMLQETINKLRQDIHDNREIHHTLNVWEGQAQTVRQLQEIRTFRGTLNAHEAVQEAVLLAAERLLEHPRPLTGKFGERSVLHLPLIEAVVRDHQQGTEEVLELLEEAGEVAGQLEPDLLAHLREVQQRQDLDTQVFLKVVEGWQQIPGTDEFLPRLQKLQQDLQSWRVSIVQLGQLFEGYKT
ncbi:hypothetical protein [Deinococcus cellulosilyticus]|uniref:Uncharacterized protein n=1 Tax=Deinococcus cellulosilyticus (strain DSM 18568 / NBRC 106333 / KACC 11606 / 5516J-15) TaxID=1223518 RepID=A0A511NA69_DEIC1|nr:hypothetical protein [Deinococcus cellulosilyticus]GEM49467.1 hypothetical protein DC3_51020 [Deinococcus cellulosilyticus NBRC 106333 = KACC 11606]